MGWFNVICVLESVLQKCNQPGNLFYTTTKKKLIGEVMIIIISDTARVYFQEWDSGGSQSLQRYVYSDVWHVKQLCW